MTTLEQANKKHARRFNEEVWGQRNFDAIEQLVAEEFVGYNPARPEPVRGPDGVRELADLLYAAFPDCEVTLEQVLADGDWVAQRVSITATHEGEFLGVDPTGRSVELTGMNLTRFVDGKWIEGYELWDMLGLFTQLGVIEPPEEQLTEEDTMTTTRRENKALVRQFIGEANEQNYDRVAALFADDYTRHDPDAGVDEQGPAPFVEALRRLHQAFPDSEVHVGELIAENDIVAFEGTMTGTHEGTFRGIEPTHEQMEIPGNAMHRISDGKIAETWATWNFLAGLQQLGAIDEPVE